MNVLFEQCAFTRSWSESATMQTSIDDEENVTLRGKAPRRAFRHSMKIEDKVCEVCNEDNPVVAYCPDCHWVLCSVCTESHKHDEVFSNHSTLTLPELRSKKACKEHDYEPKHYCETYEQRSKKTELPCKEHSKFELELYCETCEQLVCLYCTTKEHSGHNHNTINKVADKYRNQLKESTAPVENMIKELTEAYNRIDEIGCDIEKQGKEVDMEIDKYYHELIEKLKAQKEEIKQKAYDIVSQKKK